MIELTLLAIIGIAAYVTLTKQKASGATLQTQAVTTTPVQTVSTQTQSQTSNAAGLQTPITTTPAQTVTVPSTTNSGSGKIVGQATADAAIAGAALAAGPVGVAGALVGQTIKLVEDLSTPANYKPSNMYARRFIDQYRKHNIATPWGFLRTDITQLIAIPGGEKAYQATLDRYDAYIAANHLTVPTTPYAIGGGLTVPAYAKSLGYSKTGPI